MIGNKKTLRFLVCCTLFTLIVGTSMVFADNEATQYIRDGYVIEWQDAVSAKSVGYITVDNAKLRKGPGTNYDSIRSLSKDMPVIIIDEEGSWTYVRVRDASSSLGYVSGYVRSTYID